MVDADVLMPVVPTFSTSLKPIFSIRLTRSRTGIAPPIQSDQASMLQELACSAPSWRTMSAN